MGENDAELVSLTEPCSRLSHSRSRFRDGCSRLTMARKVPAPDICAFPRYPLLHLYTRRFFFYSGLLPINFAEKDWDMPWLGIGDPSRSGARRDAKTGRAKLNAAIAADRVSAELIGPSAPLLFGRRFICRRVRCNWYSSGFAPLWILSAAGETHAGLSQTLPMPKCRSFFARLENGVAAFRPYLARFCSTQQTRPFACRQARC